MSLCASALIAPFMAADLLQAGKQVQCLSEDKTKRDELKQVIGPEAKLERRESVSLQSPSLQYQPRVAARSLRSRSLNFSPLPATHRPSRQASSVRGHSLPLKAHR